MKRVFKQSFPLLILAALLPLTACGTSALPVSFVDVDWLIDVSVPEELVGFCKYVFVGEVKQILGTGRTLEDTAEGVAGIPATLYQIQVLGNIKGDLKPVEVYLEKAGGLAADEACVNLMHSGDFFPMPGGVYLFLANPSPDGGVLELGCGYAHPVIFSPEEAQQKLKALATLTAEEKNAELEKLAEATEVYQTYLFAAENEIPYGVERRLSVFDASYTGDESVHLSIVEENAQKLLDVLPVAAQYEQVSKAEQTQASGRVIVGVPPQ